MDTLQLQGIRLNTIIGIHAWEQHQPQWVIINLSLGIPSTLKAFHEDTLKGTIDYSSIVQDLKAWLSEHRCKLIEYLAEHIAQRLLNQFPIEWVKVEVSKPAILPEVETVAICIERTRTTAYQVMHTAAD